jgi:hypothetical protein
MNESKDFFTFYLLFLTCHMNRQMGLLSREHKYRDCWNIVFSNAFAGPKKP